MKQLLHRTLVGYARRFPLQKGKHRVVTRFWKPLSFGQTRRRCHLRQARVRMNCDLTKYIQREIYFFGGYEPESCARWMRLAKDAPIIFDVGANVGLYSLLASAANPGAQIHAFEPTPEVFDTLGENLALNAPTRIQANKIALGRVSGAGVLNRCDGAGGDNEGMNFVSVATEPETTAESNAEAPSGFGAGVALLTLDDYCRQHGVSHIDLMKVDVEGGEYDVFEGASELLAAKAIKCLLFESLEWAAARSGHSREAVNNQLWRHGYFLYELQGGQLKSVEPGQPHGDNLMAFAEKDRNA